ncbi:hypothetical protein ABGB12_30350 [Actinocorallia sp. B10E7]|uniref:hypothetical protein n=1 Tax=Actinocorallia sp. B10E7 TaxID=3153558 RepID=UPI00325CBA97
MWPTDALFGELIRGPHEMTVRVELWRGTQVKLSDNLEISAGSVTLDRNTDVYSAAELTVQLTENGGLLGTDAISIADLNVYGLVIRPYRGVRLPDGSAAEVPLGHLLVEHFKRAAVSTAVTVKAGGYRSYLRDAKLREPFAAGGLVARDVLLTLIQGGLPADFGTIDYDTAEWDALGTGTLPDGTVFESDRLAAIDEIATSFGVEVFPDREGVWRFRRLDEVAEPVWDLDTGPNGVQLEAQAGQDRSSVWNVVIARGEASEDAPAAQAVAENSDPSSPTYVGGPFGERVWVYTSGLLTDHAKAQAAADLLLARHSLADTVVDCTAVPHPGLDPGDAVRVSMPDGAVRVFQLDAVTIPLTVDGTLGLATRQRSMEEGV